MFVIWTTLGFFLSHVYIKFIIFIHVFPKMVSPRVLPEVCASRVFYSQLYPLVSVLDPDIEFTCACCSYYYLHICLLVWCTIRYTELWQKRFGCGKFKVPSNKYKDTLKLLPNGIDVYELLKTFRFRMVSQRTDINWKTNIIAIVIGLHKIWKLERSWL